MFLELIAEHPRTQHICLAKMNRRKLVSTAVSTSHTFPTSVTHGGSSSSSAPPQAIPIVVHVQPDDSDEHAGSKKLKLSGPGNLRSSAQMSSDANMTSDDMRVECWLERERVANKSNHPVFTPIAGWVFDEQFLEVAGLDGRARGRVAHGGEKFGQSLNDTHWIST